MVSGGQLNTLGIFDIRVNDYGNLFLIFSPSTQSLKAQMCNIQCSRRIMLYFKFNLVDHDTITEYLLKSHTLNFSQARAIHRERSYNNHKFHRHRLQFFPRIYIGIRAYLKINTRRRIIEGL